MELAIAIISVVGTVIVAVPSIIGAIMAFINLAKNTKKEDQWKLVQSIVLTAIATAEQQLANGSGADKKALAISIVNQTAASQGIDTTEMCDQISNLIDSLVGLSKVVNVKTVAKKK